MEKYFSRKWIIIDEEVAHKRIITRTNDVESVARLPSEGK
jgi:hypothetical protein